MTPPHLQKADLRRQALALRANLAAEKPTASASLAARVLELLKPYDGLVVAGYVTIGSEIDCLPVLQAAAIAGARIVLPVAAGQGVRLLFRSWTPGDPLERGPFGTSHPVAGASVAEPDVLLVPLLAFDRTGHRLGYGAGYYDRTLAALRAGGGARAVGLAFDGQEIASVPTDPNDQALDAIVTEARTLNFTPAFVGQRA